MTLATLSTALPIRLKSFWALFSHIPNVNPLWGLDESDGNH